MALPTVVDLKNRLRIRHTEEDVSLADLLTEARAKVEGLIATPILEGATDTTWDLRPQQDLRYGRCTVLRLPDWPVDVASVSLFAEGGATAEATTSYDVMDTQILSLTEGGFTAPWYRVQANVAWAHHPEYATQIEPLLWDAILGWAGYRYRFRESGVLERASGGGIRERITEQEVPPDVAAGLRRLVKVRVR